MRGPRERRHRRRLSRRPRRLCRARSRLRTADRARCSISRAFTPSRSARLAACAVARAASAISRFMCRAAPPTRSPPTFIRRPASERGCFSITRTGFVVGETAVVEDDVSILHDVTLGGTGKVAGDRHPKVRRGVMIGAGAKILGNIEIGACSRIAAGSVVLQAGAEAIRSSPACRRKWWERRNLRRAGARHGSDPARPRL